MRQTEMIRPARFTCSATESDGAGCPMRREARNKRRHGRGGINKKLPCFGNDGRGIVKFEATFSLKARQNLGDFCFVFYYTLQLPQRSRKSCLRLFACARFTQLFDRVRSDAWLVHNLAEAECLIIRHKI